MATVVDWSELQDDLIGEIAKNIGIVEDFVSFSRVCPSWRLAAVKENWVAAGPQLPWLALAEKYEKQGCNRRGFVNFKRNTRYELDLPQLGLSRSWGSSLGWIVTVTLDLEVHMFNPLSGLKLKLPHLKTLKLPDFDNGDEWFMSNYIKKAFVYERNKQLFVGVNYGGEFFFLAIARPGDQSWLQVEGDPRIRVEDAVYFNGQFIAISYDGSVELCEFDWIHTPKFVTIVPPHSHLEYCSRNYLVESMGELLMVVRWVVEGDNEDPECWYNTKRFDIYKLDFNNKKWMELKNLSDMALFLGHSDSLSLSSTDLGCEGNAIYYTDDNFEFWDYENNQFGGHDKGIFSLKDKVFHPLLDNLARDDYRSTISCPVWMVPSLF